MTFISACQVCLEKFEICHQRRSPCGYCRKSEYGECRCTPGGRCQKECDVCRVDLDYIATIEESDGCVKFCKHPIDVPYKLLRDLGDEYRRKGSTCLDLQRILVSALPELPGKSVDYISPHPYDVAYVDPFRFSEIITQEKYNAVLEKHHERLVSEFEQSHPLTENTNLEWREREKEKYVLRGLNEQRQEWRKQYMHQALRAIARKFYDEKFKEIKVLGDKLKMYSTDNIGWVHFNYDITSSIKIALQSNFGYGSASYFRIVLTYKGIQIVAYSMYVNYYYANARDLCRYTRRYKVLWGSWDEALSFVEEVSNLAIKSQGDFEKRWIVDEISDMVDGLHVVVDNPRQVFDKWIEATSPNNARLLLGVQAVQDNILQQYRCYPEEMLIDFQGEKISGALDFLDSLKRLKTIYCQVDKAVDEIVEMARQLLPRLESHAKEAAQHINNLKQELDGFIVAKKRCEELISRHRECIAQARKAARSVLGELSNPSLLKIAESSAEALYVRKHPELKQSQDEYKMLTERIDEVKKDVKCRVNFYRRLIRFKNQIIAKGISSGRGYSGYRAYGGYRR